MSTTYEIECRGCGGTLRPTIQGKGMTDNHRGVDIRCGGCGAYNWARYDRDRVEPEVAYER